MDKKIKFKLVKNTKRLFVGFFAVSIFIFGNIFFANQVSAAACGTITSGVPYTTVGTCDWTVPAGVSSITLDVKGGGGGGGDSWDGGDGISGGASSVSYGGSAKASATGGGGALNYNVGSAGGASNSIDGTNVSGGGGAGGQDCELGGGSNGGAAGAVLGGVLAVTPASIVTLAVGAGGTGYCFDANGGVGSVKITWGAGGGDTTAPTIAQVTAVTSPTTDTTPNYTFSSNEAGTITYGGSCSSATTNAISGNNPITFNALAVGTYSNCTIRVTDSSANASNLLAVNTFTIEAAGDATKPTISTFTVPATSSSLTVSGISFSAADNVGVTGYLINESSTPPTAASITSPTAPTSYTAGSAGAKTLYAWVKDAAGNVNNVYTGQPCTITIAGGGGSSPGTFTSEIKPINNSANNFGAMSWVGNVPDGPNPLVLKIRVRSLSANNEAAARSAWGESCNVVKDFSAINAGQTTYTKNDITGNPCVNNSDQFVQYQAIFSVTSGTNVPTLTSVKISTEAKYQTTWQKIISSIFNTGNSKNSVQKIEWTASNDTAGNNAQGAIGFQIRSSGDGVTWGPWCGLTACSPSSNDVSSFASGEGSYFADKSGAEVINAQQSDHQNNQYIQYAAFLKSNNGDAKPTLTEVKLTYAYNTPPEIINQDNVSPTPAYEQKNSDGTVSVKYRLRETFDDFGQNLKGTSSGSAIKTALFYQPHGGIELPIGGITNIQTGEVVLVNPANAPIPTQGVMIVDNELIEFESGSGNTISIKSTGGSGVTGTGRGASLVSANSSYRTTALAHTTANTKVFFMATRKTDGATLLHSIENLAAIGIAGQKTHFDGDLLWDAKLQSNVALDAKKLQDIRFKVMAHDADSLGFNTIGQSAQIIQTLDLQAPLISSITTDAAHTKTGVNIGNYNTNETIPLTINFSEPIVSDQQITVTLNAGYNCAISPIASPSATAQCSYQVQDSDETPQGQYLKATQISIENGGIIKDNFNNTLNNFTPTSNLDLATQIRIDNTKPTASDLNNGEIKYSKEQFSIEVRDVSDANGSGIASYQWSKVSGPGTVAFSAQNSASTNISVSNNINGAYGIKVVITDKAGNTEEKSLNLIWDTENPTNAGKPSVTSFTNDNTPTITWEKSTDTNGLAKYEVQRKTGAGGTFATVATITDEATLTATTPSHTENTLSDETYYYRIITTDKVGNISTSPLSNSMTVDTVAPELLYFYSTSPNSTASNPTAAGNINLVAVYNEEIVAGGVQVKVGPMNANPEVNLNQIQTLDPKKLEGSFEIGAPRTGFDTTPDALKIEKILLQSASDRAGNVQSQTDENVASDKNLVAHGNTIIIDTTPPILEGFTIENGKTSNSYKEGESFTLVANYNKTIKTGGIVRVILNTGSNAHEIELTNSSASKKLIGTYNVISGENASDLKVTSVVQQAVLDGKDAPLTSVGNLLNGEYVANVFGDSVENLSGARIDTQSPTNASVIINSNDEETMNQEVSLAVHVQDNLDFSGMKIQVSNDGSQWCDKNGIPVNGSGYDSNIALDGSGNATISSWNLLNSDCGAVIPIVDKEVKTVSMRFVDSAGNLAEVASDEIKYDWVLPFIQSITTNYDNGIYGLVINGEATRIPITVTYSEPLSTTQSSSITLNFNSGGNATLTTVSGNTLTGFYEVMSGDNTTALSVLSVQNNNLIQSVFDTAGKEQTSNSLTGTNLNTGPDSKSIIIDTDAPELESVANFAIDRSTATTKLGAITETNIAQGVQFNVAVMPGHEDACVFDEGSWKTYDGENFANNNVGFDDTLNSNDSRKACLKFKDSVNNETDALDIVEIFTPENPRGLQIDDISNSEISFYGAMLTWQIPANKGTADSNGGDPFAQYEIAKCQALDGNTECAPDFASVSTIADINENYLVDFPLLAENFYCYQIRFKDKHGNYSKLSQKTCLQAGHDPTVTDSQVSIISGNPEDIKISDVTEQGATVIFQTKDARYNRPLATKSFIEVFTSSTLSEASKISTTPQEDIYSVMHTIKITGLESDTEYYLKITATDSSTDGNPGKVGVLAYSPEGIPALKFRTLGTLKKIQDVSELIITDSKAVISFTTDQSAKCFIDFKDSASQTYNDLSVNIEKDFYRNHSITLTQLFAKTAYDYKITCIDKNEVTVSSDDHHFITMEKGLTQGEVDAQGDKTAPVISNIVLANVTGESATITWNTNENANSSVAYEMEGATFTKMESDYIINSNVENYSVSHAITLNGLVPATKYNFAPMSMDASGNIAVSDFIVLTTKEPSSLSSIKVVSRSLGQATISWVTGRATNSIVEYGLSTVYDQKKEDSSRVKDHEVTLSGLTPGQTYHFRVRGEDENKNIFASSDVTFQPKAPPTISEFKIDEINEHGAKVTFITNVPTDSLVEYADAKNEENSGVQGKREFLTKHAISLKNIASGVEFGVKLKVRDEEGNETEEVFQGFTTTKDENPPKIDMVRTDLALTQNDKVQAIISWKTNEQATSAIIYKEGRTGEEKEIKISNNLAMVHVGVITSFKPGTVYNFNVISSDASGNKAKSTDFALLTPRRKENIIQIIIANFMDIFGWAKF